MLEIVPFIKKNGKNPVTGEPLSQQDLVKVNFHKNDDKEFHCPVTYKVLNDQSHMLGIKESGNIYSYDAYKELNKDAKNFRDLLTDEKFEPRKSVFVINDPKNPDLFKRQKFEKGDEEESKN